MAASPPEGLDLTATIRDQEESGSGQPAESSSSVLPKALGHFGDPQGTLIERYRIEGVAGQGATSQVLAAADRVFDRLVAVKYLHEGKAADPKRLGRFIREAKLTAALEHPHIAPIYDLEMAENGSAYFTMRLISGDSLASLMDRAADGAEVPQVATVHDRVAIVLKVLDALACAHARGIIHRDLKPQNIMVGSFGEVFLVDWGCALVKAEVRAAHGRMVGTPNYMSPEQARGLAGDERSDVYGLGATLFEVLIGRVPTRAASGDEFWERKRAGRIDPPTPAERRRVPRQLLAILERALVVHPGGRYQSAEAFAADLRAWEAGLAVSAYRETPWEWIRRVHARHARPIWAGAAAILVIAACIAVIWGERLKEIATWGSPVLSERFDGPDLPAGWTAGEGEWAIEDGHLVARGQTANLLGCDQVFDGVAIEYTGRMRSGSPQGDLSVVWSSEGLGSNGAPAGRSIWLQVGAYDNSYAIVIVDRQQVVQAPFQFELDRDYRIRMEIFGEDLRILVDGREICVYRHYVPFGNGMVSLYAYHPGKVFDDLEIWARGMPEKVSALSAGERDLRDGLFDRAADLFAQVARAHAGKPIAEEARYRQGLALLRGDRAAEAEAVWATVAGTPWNGRIALHRIEAAVSRRDHDEALRLLDAVLRDQPSLRERGAALWAQTARVLAEDWNRQRAQVDAALDLRRRHLAGVPSTDGAAARLLNSVGRFDETVTTFPEVVDQATWALIHSGQASEALRRYGDRMYQRCQSLLALGRYDEILAMSAPPHWARIEAQLRSLQDPESLLATGNRVRIALILGQGADLLAAMDPERPDLFLLYALGHEERALAAWTGGWDDLARSLLLSTGAWRGHERHIAFLREAPDRHWTRWGMALGHAAAGDAEAAALALAEADASESAGDPWQWNRERWFARLVPGLLHDRAGDPAALDARLRAWRDRGPTWGEQRPWYAASFLLGDIDATRWEAQPAKANLAGCLLLLQGIRAERAGNAIGARAAYAAYLDLAPWLRGTGTLPAERDPLAEVWARWRLYILNQELP